MRAFLIVSLVVIISFITIYLLKAITGDALIAVILAMTLFVTVAGWFAGPLAAASAAGRG